jgi:putative membrane protein
MSVQQLRQRDDHPAIAASDAEPRPGTLTRRARLRAAVRRLRSDLDEVGSEPDPRFTFANERTFLAWARTGLALIGGGLVAAQVLHFGLGGAHLLVAVPAILLGGMIGIASYLRWEANERAMRLGKPLGYSPITRMLAIGVIVLALISLVLAVIAALVR